MNFEFKAFAKSVPGICIIGGVALAIASRIPMLDGGLFALGVGLTIAGFVLQILYLVLKNR